jgi:hypothetical protein
MAQTRKRGRLLSRKELDMLTPPVWVVPGIVPGDAVSMDYGKEKIGKSFLELDIALHVVTGLDWHGIPVKQGPVVYVAAEGASGYPQRIRAWEAHHGLCAEDTAAFHLFPESVNLYDPQSVQEFTQELADKHIRPVLVILDTLGRSMDGGKENDNSDMNVVIGGADTIRRETGGAAVKLVHHSGNNGLFRGASALRGGVATFAKITREGDTLTLTCGGMKDAADFDPMTLTLHAVGDSLVLVGENDTQHTQPAPKPRRFLARDVVEALRGVPNLQPSDLVRAFPDMTPDSARKWFQRLRKDGTLDALRFQGAA